MYYENGQLHRTDAEQREADLIMDELENMERIKRTLGDVFSALNEFMKYYPRTGNQDNLSNLREFIISTEEACDDLLAPIRNSLEEEMRGSIKSPPTRAFKEARDIEMRLREANMAAANEMGLFSNKL